MSKIPLKGIEAGYCLDYVLEDDSSAYGGIAFKGETLRDFLDGNNIPYSIPLWKVNKILKDCGIKEIKAVLR